jgi:Flp pilus assembly protein TadD
MKATRFHLVAVVAVLILIGVGVMRAQQNTPPRDILGGASLLFKPPQNPPTHRRKNQENISADAPVGQNSKAVVSPPATDDLSDKVEDALALGNAARDRTPPDFVYAEKAYRLAWKLNPRDPRPYVGLGNIYFDQQRYPEAAKAYKDAINLKEPTKRPVVGAFMSDESGLAITAESANQTGDLHAYLATAMLQQENLTGAEIELRDAVTIDPKNATWRAQLGYALFTQKRFTEASALYEYASRLDPNNDTYKDLLKQSLVRAREASTQDTAIAKRLEATQWEIREAVSGNIKGACGLTAGHSLDCTGGNKRPRYAAMKWKIQDGLFELESASTFRLAAPKGLSGPACIGEIRADRIYIKCSSAEIAADEIWTKQNRD